MAKKRVKVITDEELNKTVKNDNFEFASRLNKTLEKRGMTQKDLAEATGISPQTIGQYCHGVSECGASNLKKLADKLFISADYLIGRIDAEGDDIELAKISETTSLSETAILKLWGDYCLHKEPLNDFVESEEFGFILETLDYLYRANKNDKDLAIQARPRLESFHDSIPGVSFADMYFYQVSTAFDVYLDNLREKLGFKLTRKDRPTVQAPSADTTADQEGKDG